MIRMLLDKVRWRIARRLPVTTRRTFNHFAFSILHSDNLASLAAAFGSDKHGSHFYAQHYQTHFEKLRKRKLNVLEIGIGGYENPQAGGESLRMWKAFFPHSQIYGIDIFDKSPHDEKRIRTFQCSQTDRDRLNGIISEIGGVDIIIDDGSHINQHVIETFGILFPLLKDGGIYAVEDTQSSYWENVHGIEWGGSKNLAAPHTLMNHFKRFVDGLNFEEFTMDNFAPSYLDRNITAMHFYHNLLFVCKGQNNEGSNFFGHR